MESMTTKEYFDTRVDWFLGTVKKIESNDFNLPKKRQFEAMEEIKNRFVDSLKKNIDEIVRDEGMHDALLTSMSYWQTSVFNHHALPTLKNAADEHNIGEKDLRDFIYDVQLFLHENKKKTLTYDLYMRAVQETADNLVAPEGATIQ